MDVCGFHYYSHVCDLPEWNLSVATSLIQRAAISRSHFPHSACRGRGYLAMADAWYGTWQRDRWDSRHWSQSNWDAAGAWGAADGQATAAQTWPDGQQDDQPAAQALPRWDAVAATTGNACAAG